MVSFTLFTACSSSTFKESSLSMMGLWTGNVGFRLHSNVLVCYLAKKFSLPSTMVSFEKAGLFFSIPLLFSRCVN